MLLSHENSGREFYNKGSLGKAKDIKNHLAQKNIPTYLLHKKNFYEIS